MTRLMKRLAVVASILSVVMLFNAGSAEAVNFFGDACSGSGGGSAACSAPDEKISGPDGVILRVASLVAIISGIAAVIMIMIGGFNMITAGGDTNKASSGKKAVVYAVVGLMVIILARLVIGFVVTRV